MRVSSYYFFISLSMNNLLDIWVISLKAVDNSILDNMV